MKLPSSFPSLLDISLCKHVMRVVSFSSVLFNQVSLVVCEVQRLSVQASIRCGSPCFSQAVALGHIQIGILTISLLLAMHCSIRLADNKLKPKRYTGEGR